MTSNERNIMTYDYDAYHGRVIVRENGEVVRERDFYTFYAAQHHAKSLKSRDSDIDVEAIRL